MNELTEMQVNSLNLDAAKAAEESSISLVHHNARIIRDLQSQDLIALEKDLNLSEKVRLPSLHYLF